jgi:hypothetical protein
MKKLITKTTLFLKPKSNITLYLFITLSLIILLNDSYIAILDPYVPSGRAPLIITVVGFGVFGIIFPALLLIAKLHNRQKELLGLIRSLIILVIGFSFGMEASIKVETSNQLFPEFLFFSIAMLITMLTVTFFIKGRKKLFDSENS